MFVYIVLLLFFCIHTITFKAPPYPTIPHPPLKLNPLVNVLCLTLHIQWHFPFFSFILKLSNQIRLPPCYIKNTTIHNMQGEHNEKT